MQSACNCYISIWKTYFVQSSRKKLQYRDVKGLEETEVKSHKRLWEGEGREGQEYLPLYMWFQKSSDCLAMLMDR